MYRDKLICLADLDCFFVEVERLHRPELRGRPVIIGGEPGKRGVVAACSYEARKYGVHSAMPMNEAYRLAGRAPGVAFLHHGLHGNYTLYSRRVQDILRSEVPAFRGKSIDEFEMDITGCERLFTRNHGGVVEFIEYLRGRVRREVGLPISVGIGPSRIVAKMASRHGKPDGVFRVMPGEVLDFLGPHDVQAVPGIGEVTANALRLRGVERVEQLLALPERMVRNTFGAGLTGVVRALTVGDDDQKRMEDAGAFGNGERKGTAKSIGHETTFERDVIDPKVIERTLWRLTEDACRRLREADLRTRHVTVKIRYSDFTTVTRGGFISEATDVDSAVFARVCALFNESYTRRLRLRLLGVRLERLSVGSSQLQLFAGKRVLREHNLFAAVDSIRERHGRDSVYVGPGVMKINERRRVEADSTAGVSMTPVSVGGAR